LNFHFETMKKDSIVLILCLIICSSSVWAQPDSLGRIHRQKLLQATTQLTPDTVIGSLWQKYNEYLNYPGSLSIGKLTNSTGKAALFVSKELKRKGEIDVARFVLSSPGQIDSTDNIRTRFGVLEQMYPNRFVDLGITEFGYRNGGGVYNLYLRNPQTFMWTEVEKPQFTVTGTGNVGVNNQNPKAKVQVTGGDLYIDSPGTGIIMKTETGFCVKLIVNKKGKLKTIKVPCPDAGKVSN